MPKTCKRHGTPLRRVPCYRGPTAADLELEEWVEVCTDCEDEQQRHERRAWCPRCGDQNSNPADRQGFCDDCRLAADHDKLRHEGH